MQDRNNGEVLTPLHTEETVQEPVIRELHISGVGVLKPYNSVAKKDPSKEKYKELLRDNEEFREHQREWMFCSRFLSLKIFTERRLDEYMVKYQLRHGSCYYLRMASHVQDYLAFIKNSKECLNEVHRRYYKFGLEMILGEEYNEENIEENTQEFLAFVSKVLKYDYNCGRVLEKEEYALRLLVAFNMPRMCEVRYTHNLGACTLRGFLSETSYRYNALNTAIFEIFSKEYIEQLIEKYSEYCLGQIIKGDSYIFRHVLENLKGGPYTRVYLLRNIQRAIYWVMKSQNFNVMQEECLVKKLEECLEDVGYDVRGKGIPLGLYRLDSWIEDTVEECKEKK